MCQHAAQQLLSLSLSLQVKELIRNSPCAGVRTPLRDSNHPAPQATSEGGVARTSTGGAAASNCVSEEASGKVSSVCVCLSVCVAGSNALHVVCAK